MARRLPAQRQHLVARIAVGGERGGMLARRGEDGGDSGLARRHVAAQAIVVGIGGEERAPDVAALVEGRERTGRKACAASKTKQDR
jgi:hypothetical protein